MIQPCKISIQYSKMGNNIGLLFLGGVAVWLFSQPVPAKTVTVRRRKGRAGGLWNTELPHLYGHDEPRIPVTPTVGSLGSAQGLVEHLYKSRQAFYKQQEDEGRKILNESLLMVHGEPGDESGWIIEPYFPLSTLNKEFKER